MKRPSCGAWLVISMVLAAPLPGRAAALLPVGVLGNSGQAGLPLVKVDPYTLDHCSGGVYCDRDFTLWASGGEALNRYSLSGWLVQRVPLSPAGSHVDTMNFAELDGALYFLGTLKGGKRAVFRYPLAGAAEATALAVELPVQRCWCIPVLAARPLQGNLVLIFEAQGEPEGVSTLYLLDPVAGKLAKTGTVPLLYPMGLVVDQERQALYVGGQIDFSPDPRATAWRYGATLVKPDGTLAEAGWPVAATRTPQLRGRLSGADGSLWDSVWYGNVARLDRQVDGDPGIVVTWNHDLGMAGQILGLADRDPAGPGKRLLAVTAAGPDTLYLARWEEQTRQLELVSRLGSLAAHSVGLSAEGWVTASSDRCTYWWRWEDGPSTVPRQANLHVALTPGCFDGEEFFALAAEYNVNGQKYTPAVFSPRVGGNNEARRTAAPVALKQPRGLTVLRDKPGDPNGRLVVSDGASKALWETRLRVAEGIPDAEQWKPVALAPGVQLAEPGDVVGVGEGRLLLADGPAVLLLQPGENGYTVAARLESWGTQPEQRFGQHLRLAASGQWLLVSDTDRHRLLWFEWPTQRFLAQLGSCDHAGPGWYELDRPGPVALEGARAVVADVGNQRVLKLELLLEKK